MKITCMEYLLWTRHDAKCFAVFSLTPVTCGVGAVITAVSQKMKLRFRDIKCLANCVLKWDDLSGLRICCWNNELRSMNRNCI